MDYKQRFEPKGNKIIHGAGQSLEAFTNYCKAVGKYKPIIYMTYVKIHHIDKNIEKIKKEMKAFPNVILQIGFNFLIDGNDATKDIAGGKYDKELERFFKTLLELDKPIFIRLGYEFDKREKYIPEDFIKAWKYIVDNYISENKKIATVWCACPYNGTVPVEPYYPGDKYVDWFGVDVFAKSAFTYSGVENFLKLAEKHKKPVMIGESTPARTGVDKGQESWDEWFVPYFNWIKKHPIIKAFCYINWDWVKDWKNPTSFAHWLNGRIHENEIVRKNYVKELKNPRFIHNQEMNSFLEKVYH